MQRYQSLRGSPQHPLGSGLVPRPPTFTCLVTSSRAQVLTAEAPTHGLHGPTPSTSHAGAIATANPSRATHAAPDGPRDPARSNGHRSGSDAHATSSVDGDASSSSSSSGSNGYSSNGYSSNGSKPRASVRWQHRLGSMDEVESLQAAAAEKAKQYAAARRAAAVEKFHRKRGTEAPPAADAAAPPAAAAAAGPAQSKQTKSPAADSRYPQPPPEQAKQYVAAARVAAADKFHRERDQAAAAAETAAAKEAAQREAERRAARAAAEAKAAEKREAEVRAAAERLARFQAMRAAQEAAAAELRAAAAAPPAALPHVGDFASAPAPAYASSAPAAAHAAAAYVPAAAAHAAPAYAPAAAAHAAPVYAAAAAAAVPTAAVAGTSSRTVGYSDCVMLQAFGWDSCREEGWYQKLLAQVKDMQAAGVTHVWLPPPSSSPASPQGYTPGQLYNLNSSYGSEEDLRMLTRAIRQAGMLPMADIVLNHRCAAKQPLSKFGEDMDPQGRKVDWDQWAVENGAPLFKADTDAGAGFGQVPSLDHANPELRDGLKQWLKHLQENVGFCGWRLGYAKGFGAEYVEEYVHASVGPKAVTASEFWTDLKWNGPELDYNQNGARQQLCDWMDASKKSTAAFDVPTKGILQEAAAKLQYWRLRDAQGKAPGLVGWWPQRAVTFVDTAETGSSKRNWPFPEGKEAVGYAYILTHPGIPCILWEHMFSDNEELHDAIEALLQIRKRNGIKSGSSLQIVCAETDMYVACVNERVVLKLGPRFDMGYHLPKAEEGWSLAAFGQDWAVWEKAQA